MDWEEYLILNIQDIALYHLLISVPTLWLKNIKIGFCEKSDMENYIFVCYKISTNCQYIQLFFIVPRTPSSKNTPETQTVNQLKKKRKEVSIYIF